jgi:hypothetical protein
MATAATALAAGPAHAVPLLGTSDQIIPIDLDNPVSHSSTPAGGAEDPVKALDGNITTKYLNFGQNNSGLIVTPAAGFKQLQSFRISTANDGVERDPLSYEIYGTNDPITSTNNSTGSAEDWTLLGHGGLSLPAGRGAVGPLVTVSNPFLFQSYRVIFPTVKNSGTANSMQIADIAFYDTLDASTPNFLSASDAVLGIDRDLASSTPGGGGEDPVKALDNNPGSKYLNFGKENAGFIVAPSIGPLTVVTGISFTTANDAPERTPASWALYGSADPILSLPNSQGMDENWTLIDQGSLSLSDSPGVPSGLIAVNNSNAYSIYRLVFPTVKNGGAANSVQIADVQFEGSVVPEPSTFVLGGIGLTALVALRRRRK